MIRINVEQGRVQQSIKDNGKGFDPDAATGGMGLINMHERAESIGGLLEVASERHLGTTVRVVIPLEMGANHE